MKLRKIRLDKETPLANWSEKCGRTLLLGFVFYLWLPFSEGIITPICMDSKTDTGPNLTDQYQMESQAFDMEELIAGYAMGEKSLSVLLLANEGYTAGCCSDYIKAIKNNSRHSVTIRNPMPKSRLDKLLGRPRIPLKNESGEDYDVVIIHIQSSFFSMIMFLDI